jgi:hypothetical protein
MGGGFAVLPSPEDLGEGLGVRLKYLKYLLFYSLVGRVGGI